MAKKKINIELLDLAEQKEYEKLQKQSEKKRAEEALKKLRSEQKGKSFTSKTFDKVEKVMKPSPKIRSVKPRIPYTPQQGFFRTFMGGRRTFGTGHNLPVINHSLTSGFGLVKHPLQNETRKLFGFGYMRT